MCVLHVANDEFIERKFLFTSGEAITVCEPCRNDPLVLLMTFWRAKCAEIDVFTVEAHAGLIAGEVISVGGYF